jgi:hypothetical protein
MQIGISARGSTPAAFRHNLLPVGCYSVPPRPEVTSKCGDGPSSTSASPDELRERGNISDQRVSFERKTLQGSSRRVRITTSFFGLYKPAGQVTAGQPTSWKVNAHPLPRRPPDRLLGAGVPSTLIRATPETLGVDCASSAASNNPICSMGSSAFPQTRATSALRALAVIQVAHFDLGCRGNLYAGAASRIHAVPNSLADLCAYEPLFELPRVPGPNCKTFLLSLKVDLQCCLYKPRLSLDLPGLSAYVAEWAGLQRYLNLDPAEWSRPCAGQICFGTRGNTGDDGHESSQCHRIVNSHDNLLGSPVDRSHNLHVRPHSRARPRPLS